MVVGDDAAPVDIKDGAEEVNNNNGLIIKYNNALAASG